MFLFYGLLKFFEKDRKNACYLMAVIFFYLVTISGFPDWWGGWSPGPRYLVSITPLLAICASFFFSDLWNREKFRIFTRICVGGTFFLSLLYWQDPRRLWN